MFRARSLAPHRVLAGALFLLGCVPVLVPHATETPGRDLAPGVSYRQFVDSAGPWVEYELRIDLRRATLRHVRALDSLRGRERTSAMAHRVGAAGTPVLGAVNADFFELGSGENENNQVLAGEWWKGLKVTESPYDTWDNVHAQLALDSANRGAIDRFEFDGRAWSRGMMTPILTLNALPTGTHEGTALFTPRYGMATALDTSRAWIGAPLGAAGARGDTALFVRRDAVVAGSAVPIPRDGAVLAAFGPRADAVRAMAVGDTVRILLGMRPVLPGGGSPSLVVGGWPRILRDGRNVALESARVEGTISRNAEVRHPRSAVGLSRDGATMVLLVVDGRSPRSVGMTLDELAETMRRLGAWQALNFDGGGSSTMVIDGAVVNAPSDATGERAVGNALLVVRGR